MRTQIILAAFALAAAPALAQQAAPADPAMPASDAAAPAAAPADAAASAAPAGATAQLTPGATVFDTQGGTVGTIEAVNGTDVVVSTGTAKASIPVASFGQGANGPVLSLTKAQLEAAVSGGAAGPGGR